MKYAVIAVALFATTCVVSPSFGKDKAHLSYVPATLLGFQTVSTGSKSTTTPHTFTMGGKTFEMPATTNTHDVRVRIYQIQIGDVLYSVRGNRGIRDHAAGETLSVSVNEKDETIFVLGKNGKPDGCKIMGEIKAVPPEAK
jgi:hypothetical protein